VIYGKNRKLGAFGGTKEKIRFILEIFFTAFGNVFFTNSNCQNECHQFMKVHRVNLCDFGVHAVTTHDRNVFSFFPDHRPCKGFEEALSRYKELAPHVCLAGRFTILYFQVL
jgi:hypothetical protein